MRNRFKRLAQANQMCYPLAVIMLDRILHTDDHPQCADITCPCHEDAPYQSCPCQRCTFVRQTLAEWQAWSDEAEQAPTEPS